MQNNGHWADKGDPDHLRVPREFYLAPFWTRNIVQLMQYTATLEPRPTIIIFNTGIHLMYCRNHRCGFDNPQLIRSVVDAALKTTPHFIYRTTTFGLHDKNQTSLRHSDNMDTTVCNFRDVVCLNVSWTRCLPDDIYWDEWHFYAEPYNRMIRQLFDIIRQMIYPLPLP